MQPATEPSQVLSPRIYALILTSPRLRRMLLPQGLLPSPYEVLSYHSTLILHDAGGNQATVRRTQRIRFLQDGVSGLLDHTWGDGVVLTSYHNEAGILEDSFRDEGRRHLVIGLRQPMRRGDILTFGVVRTAMVGFTEDEEWLETVIDHPAGQLSRSIVFPKARPCLCASLEHEGCERPLSIVALPDGRTTVGFDIPRPHANTPYTIRWAW